MEEDRYKKLLDALEAERKQEEDYYRELSSSKSNKEKVESGILWYPVEQIGQHYTIGERIEIEVKRKKAIDSSHRFKTGIGVSVKFMSSETTEFGGVVSYIRKNRMGIILSSQVVHMDQLELPGSIGVEMIYDERPYRVMRESLKNLMSSKDPILMDLREGVRTGKFSSRYNPDEKEIHIHDTHLNESQLHAVKSCLRSTHFSIIHGPPGTGKTTTLVSLIKHLLKTEKRVLVCAPSNNAVDLLAKSISAEGIDTLRIGNISRMSDDITNLALLEKARNSAEWQNIKKIRIEAEEARRMGSNFKRKFGYQEKMNRKAMFAEAKELKKWAREKEKELLHKLVSDAKVICSTLIGCAHSDIEDIRFKTVCIDEASQALEAECWTAMMKAEKVVLAGDHLQLPPTVKSAKAKEMGLEKTLLTSLADKIENSFLLREQYRMNEKILSFSNEEFYENQLRTPDGISKWTLEGDQEPLVFIDTAGCGFDEKLDVESRSRYNEGEYFILREVLLANKEMFGKHSVGIISPYAQQVRYIRSKWEEEKELKGMDITVNSIDGFQGQEKDAIIISLVRSNEKGEIGFLADARRLNVAMTRAKKKLIMIGDSATLSNNPLFVRLIEHVEKEGTYKSGWEYMA